MALKISLDQWQALVAVVDAGGYAQAAESLSKTQSTISYAIRKIEEMLDVPVFRMEGRKAVLTESGRVLYRRGKALLEEATRAERSAASLAAGWEAELRIAVEAVFPTWLLLGCMASFAEEHPDTCIELYESVLDGTNELLLEGQVDVAITSQIPPGFLGDSLLQTRAIAVAAPAHSLAAQGREVTLADLRESRHILIRDTGSQRRRTPGWQGADQRWTVSNKATSIRALCMGMGFAWVPEEMIRDELDAGELVRLPLVEGAERSVTLYLVHADPYAVGPGAKRFEQLVREAVVDCPGEET